MQEGGAVLPQAVQELTLQGGGELQELVRVEERRHRRVETVSKQWKGGSGFICYSHTRTWQSNSAAASLTARRRWSSSSR